SRKFIGEAPETFDCGACNDLGLDGPVVIALNKGPVAQSAIQYAIVTSMHDEAITPPETAFVDEPDVIIQEYCPDEISDHMAESLDPECFAPLVNTLLYGETFRPQTHSTGPGV
ncbi:hypothetical protein DOTSEDRAFT_114481, partial [Dothistroma septosporum NZE10]